MNSEKQIWFPAKRYGWGWGLPVTWQGWVVSIAWLIVLIVDAVLFARPGLWPWYVLSLLSATAVLIAICWWKGEKPRWRWGD